MKEKGFTLIELLVVIAIIGILAAIAIPQFAEYRQRGFDSRARSDLRNTATAEEAYYAENEEYLALTAADGVLAAGVDLPGIASLSAGTNLEIELVAAAAGVAEGFTGTATNSRGSGVTYGWDSNAGGDQGAQAAP